MALSEQLGEFLGVIIVVALFGHDSLYLRLVFDKSFTTLAHDPLRAGVALDRQSLVTLLATAVNSEGRDGTSPVGGCCC